MDADPQTKKRFHMNNSTLSDLQKQKKINEERFSAANKTDLDELLIDNEEMSSISQNQPEDLQQVAIDSLKKEDPIGRSYLDKLPPVLRDYILALCDTTDADPIMITSSVISSISAMLGTKVYIPKGYGGYFQNLYTNVWILNIAQSGQHKTTALNTGASIALERQYKIFDEIEILNQKSKTPESNKESIESEKLKLSLDNPVLPTRLTAEGLLKYLAQGHEGLIITSEFGAWLDNLAKSHNSDLMGILTDLYDVPPIWRNLTKTQGDDILKTPCVSIVGVTTMSWLKKRFSQKDIEGGFGARFLIYTPPHSEKISPGLPKPIDPKRVEAQEQFKKSFINIENEIGERRIFRLSPDAAAYFDDPITNNGLHQQISTFVKNNKCKDLLDAYARRWSPSVLKIAMIMQLFYDPSSKEITTKALFSAWMLIAPAMKSTALLFSGEFVESEEDHEIRALYEWICMKVAKEGRGVTRKEILTSRKVKGKKKEYDLVLDMLIESGKIEKIKIEGGKAMEISYHPLKQEVEKVE